METTDENAEQIQRAAAEEAIATTAKRSKSRKRRLEMLGYCRDNFQFLDWQIAIDLVEAQMIAWGQVEHTENMGLYASYTQEMNHYRLDVPKAGRSDEDYQRHGHFRAYALARYTIRFMTLADALAHLEEWLAGFLKNLPKNSFLANNPNERIRVAAFCETLQLVIDQLRALLALTNSPLSPPAPTPPPDLPSPDSP